MKDGRLRLDQLFLKLRWGTAHINTKIVQRAATSFKIGGVGGGESLLEIKLICCKSKARFVESYGILMPILIDSSIKQMSAIL